MVEECWLSTTFQPVKWLYGGSNALLPVSNSGTWKKNTQKPEQKALENIAKRADVLPLLLLLFRLLPECSRAPSSEWWAEFSSQQHWVPKVLSATWEAALCLWIEQAGSSIEVGSEQHLLCLVILLLLLPWSLIEMRLWAGKSSL